MPAMRESAVNVSRVIAVGLGSALLIALVGAPAQAAPAERAQAKCVSKAEYGAIHKGQSKAKVHQIVQNQKPYSSTVKVETYEACDGSPVYVRYQGSTVTSKSKGLVSVS